MDRRNLRSWRTPLLVLVVCSLLVVTLVPGTAMPGDPGKGGKYRAEFISSVRAPPHAMGTLYLDDEILEISVSDAADIYAERQMEFQESAQEAAEAREDEDEPEDRSEGRSKSEEDDKSTSAQSANEPAFAYAGFFSLLERAVFEGRNPPVTCSDLHNHHHSTYSIRNPLYEATDIAYIGAAYSEVAAYGSGTLSDGLGTHVDYAYPVFYAGPSDFFCYEISVSYTLVVNSPTVYGGVIVGVDD